MGLGLTRSLHLGRWPRTLAPGFLQALMNSGIPMDISVHLAPISADQAARTLEWQKVRFESARSLSFRKGRSLSPEAEIALEDVTRLRDEVQRGRERLFHSSLSHDPSFQTITRDLKDITQTHESSLCRHPGQARCTALPPEGGASIDPTTKSQLRCALAHHGHLFPGPAVSLLSP